MRRPASPAGLFLIATAVAIILVAVADLWLHPVFDTNDDVFMAMIANGTGIARAPDAFFIHSNVVLGWLISRLARVASFDSYSLHVYGAWALSLVTAALALLRLTPSVPARLACGAVLAVVFGPALVYPQFTIFATLLSGSAFLLGLSLLLHAPRTSIETRRYLTLAAACALYGFLVRPTSFFLSLILIAPLCAPFIGRQGAQERRLLGKWLLAVLGFCALFLLLNYAAYRNSGVWGAFFESASSRVKIIDFNAVSEDCVSDAALRDNGWSMVELSMIRDWYLVEPDFVSDSKLAHLLEASDSCRNWGETVRSFSQVTNQLADARIALALLALLAAVVMLSRRSMVALGLGLSVLATIIVTIHLLGRIPLYRVYFPPIAVLALAAGLLAASDTRETASSAWLRVRLILFAVVVLVLAVAQSAKIVNGVAARQTRIAQADVDLRSLVALGDNIYVIWGGHFPFPLAWPVSLARSGPIPAGQLRLVLTALPEPILGYRRSEYGPHDLTRALVKNDTVRLVGDLPSVQLFSRYFLRKHGEEICVEIVHAGPSFTAFRLRLARDCGPGDGHAASPRTLATFSSADILDATRTGVGSLSPRDKVLAAADGAAVFTPRSPGDHVALPSVTLPRDGERWLRISLRFAYRPGAAVSRSCKAFLQDDAYRFLGWVACDERMRLDLGDSMLVPPFSRAVRVVFYDSSARTTALPSELAVIVK